MGWVYLFIASFGEIFGMAAINLYIEKKSWQRLLLVVITFGFGFLFLALAMIDIPLATAYAVWTGLGVIGTVIVGVLFFRETMSTLRMLFLTLIITGAVGLRVVG